MRLPLSWLHDYCAPPLDAAGLAQRLAMTGTETERVTHHGTADAGGFVVGRVLAAEPHPNADRLRLCSVATGGSDVATIVCGAPNVTAGQTVAVALPGALMPDGSRLKAVKLRGVRSEGMILAEDEVGIGTDHGGIMELAQDLQPGAALAGVLPISDDVIELEITPNRPDCLGVYGLAREVHAATGAPLQPPPWTADPGSPGPVDGAAVAVEAPELCPRFTARLFEDVHVGPSPPWLKARLMAAGQRPVCNVVDITNYAMLETVHPLHAFDLDLVAGARLTVRRAGEGERVTTLDGVQRTLDPGIALICDEQGPASIAGLMGGERSEVSGATTRVLLEAATWERASIQRASSRLGLRSEASARFEKGLSPEGALEAQAVATRLLAELCGARVAPGTIDVGGPGPAPATIRLRDARVAGLLGRAIERERCAQILTALGFGADGVDGADGGLDVSVPHYRRLDVTREADVIEEVARIDGLDKLPATLPPRRGASGRLTRRQWLRRRASDALVARGLREIVGWSFASPRLAAELRLPADDERRAFVTLENPISEEQSVLRTTLLGSLLDAARRNLAHGAGGVALFESGAVYMRAAAGPLPREPERVAALLSGPARPATWRDPRPPAADFYAAKGVLESLLGALRVGWRVQPAAQPFLHPGRAAAVLAGDEQVGWIGELHPAVAASWDLGAAAAFELDFDTLSAAAPAITTYEDVTSYPQARQDLAVSLADDVPAARVLEVVRRAGGELLAGAEVFDVYRGEQVGEGRVSLAVALTFGASDRTLTDGEVDERRARIIAALQSELEAVARA